MDILELMRQEGLLQFLYHTLQLYSDMCSLGSHCMVYVLCSHMDKLQLLHTIESKYILDVLCASYYDLPLDIHLSTYSSTCIMISCEFIVSMTEDTKRIMDFTDEHTRQGLLDINLDTLL